MGRVSEDMLRSCRLHTHMSLIVQRAHIQLRTVRAPAHRRRGTSDLERCNGLLRRLLPALPHLHRPVVRRGRHELLPAPTRHRPVERVDDLAVRADLAHALAGGDVRVCERVVGGDGVDEGGTEGPLEVEDGRLGKIL